MFSSLSFYIEITLKTSLGENGVFKGSSLMPPPPPDRSSVLGPAFLDETHARRRRVKKKILASDKSARKSRKMADAIS